MHPILTEHPEYVAVEEKHRDLEAAREVFSQRQRETREEYERAKLEHRRALREAVLRGDSLPPEPVEPPDETDQAHLFLEELSKLRTERRELVASLADELEAAAEDRVSELLDRARPLVAELEGIAEESADLVATMRHLRQHEERSRGVTPGTGGSDRMRSGVTPAELVNCVLRDERLLDPVKPPPRAGVLTREGEL